MNVKVNDNVLVIAGKDKGVQGKVLATSPKANTVTVEGARVQKKHAKARKANETSEIKSVPGPIDASNVMVVCPTCGKATRVKHAVVDGKKVRVCACGAVLDKAYAKKAAKAAAATEEAPKKRTRKRAAKAEATETTENK
jgi:large subunit ribosomal protein L24